MKFKLCLLKMKIKADDINTYTPHRILLLFSRLF
jgi:hypothetical protein